MKMQVASQSMNSKCINNSKLNSNAFKCSINFFLSANKIAHDEMLNMIITVGSLHGRDPSSRNGRLTVRGSRSSSDYPGTGRPGR